MNHLTPLLLSISVLTASAGVDASSPSHAPVRCAKAIDDLVVDATRVAESWEQSEEFQGWCVSKWPSQGEPALAQLLDENDYLFTKIDLILKNPSLRDAIPLTERVREHGSPSLMQTRALCNILCARSVISAQRGDTAESARRLEQAVHLSLSMTAWNGFGRVILSSLSWSWKDTLAVLFKVPTFQPIEARAQLDSRLTDISNELSADLEHPYWTQLVLADAELMRSALAAVVYRHEHGAWPGSSGEAFAKLDGDGETSRVPSALTCLRRTSSGVCIFATVEAPRSTVQRRLITLREPSDASNMR